MLLGQDCERRLINNVAITHFIEEKCVSLLEARKEGFVRRAVCFLGAV